MRGFLQEKKSFKDSCIAKVYSTMDDSSQMFGNLEHIAVCLQLNGLQGFFTMLWFTFFPCSTGFCFL